MLCVLDINQLSLSTIFILFLCLFLSVSVSMAFPTVFHSINSPDKSPLSHSGLLVLFCLIGPFNHISMKAFQSPDIIFVVDWAQRSN